VHGAVFKYGGFYCMACWAMPQLQLSALHHNRHPQPGRERDGDLIPNGLLISKPTKLNQQITQQKLP
jgi:hypothetical protein